MFMAACHCFSLCNTTEVHSFLTLRPNTVVDESSVWFAYLSHVYAGPPVTPTVRL